MRGSHFIFLHKQRRTAFIVLFWEIRSGQSGGGGSHNACCQIEVRGSYRERKVNAMLNWTNIKPTLNYRLVFPGMPRADSTCPGYHPTNTGRWTNVLLRLGKRRRCWSSVEPTLDLHLFFVSRFHIASKRKVNYQKTLIKGWQNVGPVFQTSAEFAQQLK